MVRVKGKEAVLLLNVGCFTMSTRCDNVATHLAFKQEAKVGRKCTVYPDDDISETEI